MRLPRPELCLPAARLRTTRGCTLAPPANVDFHDSQALRAAEVVALTSVCCQVWQDDAQAALTMNGRERCCRESWPCWRAAELLSASATLATAKACSCRLPSLVRAVARAADVF